MTAAPTIPPISSSFSSYFPPFPVGGRPSTLADIEDIANRLKTARSLSRSCSCDGCARSCSDSDSQPGAYDPVHVLSLIAAGTLHWEDIVKDFYATSPDDLVFYLRPKTTDENGGGLAEFWPTVATAATKTRFGQATPFGA